MYLRLSSTHMGTDQVYSSQCDDSLEGTPMFVDAQRTYLSTFASQFDYSLGGKHMLVGTQHIEDDMISSHAPTFAS